MSKLPPVQDVPDDIELDDRALAALHDGFLQLDTPPSTDRVETIVKQELTSGTDFDPLPRQIGRRAVWTVVPALAAFLVASGVLALRPVPRIPLNQWVKSHGGDYQRPDVSDLDSAYSTAAPLPKLTKSADGFATQVTGTDAPQWFSSAPPAPMPELFESTDGLVNRVVGSDDAKRLGFATDQNGFIIVIKHTDDAKRHGLVISENKRVQLNVQSNTKGAVTHK